MQQEESFRLVNEILFCLVISLIPFLPTGLRRYICTHRCVQNNIGRQENEAYTVKRTFVKLC